MGLTPWVGGQIMPQGQIRLWLLSALSPWILSCLPRKSLSHPQQGTSHIYCTLEGSTGPHAGPRKLLGRQLSPLSSPAPLTCQLPVLFFRHLPAPPNPYLPEPLPHALSGCRPCHLSSFLDLSICSHIFCLLSLLLLGKLSNAELCCTDNAVGRLASLV